MASVPKTRCNGMWTEARFNSFVKSQLRKGSMKWAPINIAKKAAWRRRGFYLCADCGIEAPTTLDPETKGGKRIKNVYVDHIAPIVDPAEGFTTWDDYIERLYCELENLQVLCKTCHDGKSDIEKSIAAERRRTEKELGK